MSTWCVRVFEEWMSTYIFEELTTTGEGEPLILTAGGEQESLWKGLGCPARLEGLRMRTSPYWSIMQIPGFMQVYA